MAEWETTTITVAPGVTRQDYGSHYYLEGSKDNLLRAGLAWPEWFLDGQVRDKRGKTIRQVKVEHEGRRVVCIQPAKGPCSISINCTPEEAERFEASRGKASQRARDELDRRLVAEWQRERMRKALATPGGIHEEASNFLQTAEMFMTIAFNAAGDPEYPWSFPAETLEKVKWHFREIMQLFEDGGFVVRPGSILQSNGEFQRFMARATSEAGEQRPDARGTA